MSICDVIVIFLIYSQFGAIQKLDSGCKICKTHIFINNNLFYLTKTEKRTKKSLTQLSNYSLSKGTILPKKFCKKMETSAKSGGSRY